MYPDYQFWLEQAIAFCIAAVMVYFVDKFSSKKHSKEAKE